MVHRASPTSVILSRIARGEPAAAGELFPAVYDDLKRLASARLRNLKPGQTLQPTALVHEAWLKLDGADPTAWQGRAHFFGAAANAMRNILVDQARRKARLKRDAGAQAREPLSELASPDTPLAEDLIALDEALDSLSLEYDRPARIVMLRYFSGLAMREIAELLEVSERTVDREWLFARTWLRRSLDAG